MDRKLYFIIFLLVLAPSILAQRGGGGGGGGRSGGGSFRSRSYSGVSCQTKCMGEPSCLQQCRTGSTIGIVLSSLFGIGICGIFIRSCYANNCCSCCTTKLKYNQLKKEYNIVDTTSMPIQEFRMKRDRIINLINQSQNNHNFALEQQTQKIYMSAQVEIVEQKDFLTEIKVTGSDKFGTWKGQGYIMCKESGIFMWIYKEYDDKASAGQTGEWEHLVYKSTNYNDQTGMEGSWCYLGFQLSDVFAGKWKLWPPTPTSQTPIFYQPYF